MTFFSSIQNTHAHKNKKDIFKLLVTKPFWLQLSSLHSKKWWVIFFNPTDGLHILSHNIGLFSKKHFFFLYIFFWIAQMKERHTGL